MKIPSNVKVKKFPWTILPVFSKYTAHAIYPYIYVPKYIYTNLRNKNPNPKYVSVLIHEQAHLKRQKKMGWLKWGLGYVFSPSFRFAEELAAIKTAMKYLKKKNLTWDTKKSAGFLLGYLYLWCVNYETAKRKLDEAWSNT